MSIEIDIPFFFMILTSEFGKALFDTYLDSRFTVISIRVGLHIMNEQGHSNIMLP